MPRKILHLDLDAFYCAVEEIKNPSLAGKPFAVGGRPDQRGVVSSCSYPARCKGVHSAMPMYQAKKLCPDLLIISAHFEWYRDYSNKVMHILNQMTPLVEQISIDEAFLDLTDLPDSLQTLAQQLQTRIDQELGLPCSIGGATNKLVAKIATDTAKSHKKTELPPRAILIIPPGEETSFLAPLPIQAMWGIGPKMAARFNRLGIQTIGDLAHFTEPQLIHLFGKLGKDIFNRSRGIDNAPVTSFHEIKSISQEITFDKDISDTPRLERVLHTLSEQVGFRLRQKKLAGTTIRIKIRWSNFTTLTRQKSFRQPIDSDRLIFETAIQLLHENRPSQKPVRLLGIGISGLTTPHHQLELFDTKLQKERILEHTIDSLKERFGKNSITHASTLTRSGGEDSHKQK